MWLIAGLKGTHGIRVPTDKYDIQFSILVPIVFAVVPWVRLPVVTRHCFVSSVAGPLRWKTAWTYSRYLTLVSGALWQAKCFNAGLGYVHSEGDWRQMTRGSATLTLI